EIEPAHSGKVYIEENEIRFRLLEQGTRSLGGTGFGDVVTKGRKRSPHAVAGGFFIVDNHQSQRVFSHFLSSLGPSGPKLLARRVPQTTSASAWRRRRE